MTRIATRYAAALAEAQEARDILKKALSVQMNFGDADNPDNLARRCLDLATRVDAAAGHYRAAALAVKRAAEPRKADTYEARMGWI